MNLVWNKTVISKARFKSGTILYRVYLMYSRITLFLLLFLFLITLERLYTFLLSVYISNTDILLTFWENATLSQQGSSLAEQERLREMCGQLGFPALPSSSVSDPGLDSMRSVDPDSGWQK